MMRPLKIITSSTSSRHGRSSSASFSPCLSALVLGTIFVVFVAPQARLASAADANSNVAAGAAASLSSTIRPKPADLSTDQGAAAASAAKYFAPFQQPVTAAEFSSFCTQFAEATTMNQFDQIYAAAHTTASLPGPAIAAANNTSSCVPLRGCILSLRDTAVVQRPWSPVTSIWRGKCFFSDGSVTNFANPGDPHSSTVIRGRWGLGASLTAAGGDTVTVRYNSSDLQAYGAWLVTAGFMGTGANRLGDILDEIRPVAPGLYIGYAFAKDRRDSRGKNQPHSSFYFALAAVKQQAVAS